MKEATMKGVLIGLGIVLVFWVGVFVLGGLILLVH